MDDAFIEPGARLPTTIASGRPEPQPKPRAAPFACLLLLAPLVSFAGSQLRDL